MYYIYKNFVNVKTIVARYVIELLSLGKKQSDTKTTSQ